MQRNFLKRQQTFLLFSRWHHLAFSIKGDSVTLIPDCNETITKELARRSVSSISNDGVIAVGHSFGSEESFNVSKIILYKFSNDQLILQGDMQLLKIAPTPDEAYELCEKRVKDCGNLIGENKSHASLAENLEATTKSIICNDEDCAYDSLTEDEEEAFTPLTGNFSSSAVVHTI